MKLEHVLFPREGVCSLVVSADAAELETAYAAELAATPNASEEDLLNNAVNRTLVNCISPVYHQAMQEYHFTPITDPDFDLQAVNRAEGFVASAEFYILPELTLGSYTGFVQAVEPKPVREFSIQLEINMHHQAEYNAADEAGKQAIFQQIAQTIHEKNCCAAQSTAKLALVQQLGNQVFGPICKTLLDENYLAEMRKFYLRLEANKLPFTMYLQASHQTEEEWKAELQTIAERNLRTAMGLLMVAEKEHLAPTNEEVTAELHHWNAAIYQKPTFLANDIRRIRQRLASEMAKDFIVAHSTLIPPPSTPTIQLANEQ